MFMEVYGMCMCIYGTSEAAKNNEGVVRAEFKRLSQLALLSVLAVAVAVFVVCLCDCVCVCVCVSVHACACMRACVRACSQFSCCKLQAAEPIRVCAYCLHLPKANLGQLARTAHVTKEQDTDSDGSKRGY